MFFFRGCKVEPVPIPKTQRVHLEQLATRFTGASDPHKGRIAFFMVPTNPLAYQQKRQLEMLVKRVEIVVGESKKGNSKNSWGKLLRDHDVIVCTPAILKNALEFGFLTMRQDPNAGQGYLSPTRTLRTGVIAVSPTGTHNTRTGTLAAPAALTEHHDVNKSESNGESDSDQIVALERVASPPSVQEDKSVNQTQLRPRVISIDWEEEDDSENGDDWEEEDNSENGEEQNHGKDWEERNGTRDLERQSDTESEE